jgi:hypothetical protein
VTEIARAAAAPSLPLGASLAGHACLLALALRPAGAGGNGVEALALAAFVLLAGVAYARAAARPHALDARAVFRGGALVLLLAAAIPPVLSNEVFDGLARGRVEAVHGCNPYSLPPGQFPEDPFARAAERTGFGNPAGPLATAAHTAVCFVCGDSVWLGAYLMKALCALGLLLTAWLVYRAAAILAPPHAARAAFLWLWNPWILLETAGSAHAEALAALGLAAMAWALAVRRTALATVALGAAALVAPALAVLAPLLLALAWRRRELRALAGGALCAGALAALLALHYFRADGAVQGLLAPLRQPSASVPALLAALFAPGHGVAFALGGLALTAVLTLALVPGVRDVAAFARRAVLAVVCLLLFAMPVFAPWYHLWWLPLAALDARSPRVLACTAVLLPLSYLAAAVTRSFDADPRLWQWALGLVPVALLVLWPRRRAGSLPSGEPFTARST